MTDLPREVRSIKGALNGALARFVVNTQSKLSAASPVQTGRLASSWFVGTNQPNRKVEPERDEPGPITVERPDESKITIESNHFVSSNLPYSERAALDPGYVGRRGGNSNGAWFSEIENQLPKDLDRALAQAIKRIK